MVGKALKFPTGMSPHVDYYFVVPMAGSGWLAFWVAKHRSTHLILS
jgi:hypothetical protein